MLSIIKTLLVLTFFPFLIYSCTSSQHNKEQKQELTAEQKSAFEALNMLQVSTDKKNQLYSTFAGIEQPCYPPDTSFVITQSKLLAAMMQFVGDNCKNLNTKDREKLAKASVLAQSEYTVLHCTGNSSNIDYTNGIPMQGTWVMPNVLGRSDVVIVW